MTDPNPIYTQLMAELELTLAEPSEPVEESPQQQAELV